MRLRRYELGAWCYDVLSGERWIYRAPRLRAVDRLALRPGDRVLDVGCGTGLNLPLLLERVGPGGAVCGVDRSGAMLAVARRRVAASGWRNVEMLAADAGELGRVASGPFDAVLFTYSLSVIGRWQDAWTQALGLLRTGGRALVLDLALPRGRWWALRPLARIAGWTGGVDLRREPWRAVLADTLDAEHEVLRAGHVHLAVGFAG